MNVLFLVFLLFSSTLTSPTTDCNYKGRLVGEECQCEPEFSGSKCELKNDFIQMPKVETNLLEKKALPSYDNLGPKNCKAGVGCEYGINWDLGFASTTYYGAGCTDPAATTGKCGTACVKGANAEYTAAIPLAYWPPIRYGNCPTCGLDCVWNGNVLQNSKPLCWKLTPMVSVATGLPTKAGPGTPIVVHVTDSCGGNCPAGPPLTKGSCNGSSSPDCGNTALYEGAIINSPPPFKVYVGDNMASPDPVKDGYRCPDARKCNNFGTKYWSPCTQSGWTVQAPAFLDWCAGNFMAIDINTESDMRPLQSFCEGVAYPGNDASCTIKYERVDCGVVKRNAPVKYAQGYSHWDNTIGRNVYCCQEQTWGTFDTCDGVKGTMPLCTEGKTGDCFQAVC